MLIKNLFKHWTYQFFSPGTLLRRQYEAFKDLLEDDKQAHELMAEIQEIHEQQRSVDLKVLDHLYGRLSERVGGMIANLNRMCPGRYVNLHEYFRKFDFYIRFILRPPEFEFAPPFTVTMAAVSGDARQLVGGKALNLALIQQDLHLPVPRGFVVTTNAFHYLIEYNDLRETIDRHLMAIDINDPTGLERAAQELRDMVQKAAIPEEVMNAIQAGYQSIRREAGRDVRLVMRSSAVGEDAKSSFAGQYQSVFDVTEDRLLDAYRTVIASKYTPQAIYYRIHYGLSDDETPMAVLVLEMLNALASGVVYTEDLETRDARHLKIHAIHGLGDLLVKGEASPDIFRVRKITPPQVLLQQTGIQATGRRAEDEVRSADEPSGTPAVEGPSLDEVTAGKLAGWAMRMEAYFEEAQDIEWCLDQTGQLYIVQSRPLRKEEAAVGQHECHFEDISNPVLLKGGERASSGIGAGRIFKLTRESDLVNIPADAVLVARHASPRYVEVMDRLNAVVTDSGSSAGHLASVAREFGIPVIVNSQSATRDLAHGREVTVFADEKVVYDGIVAAMLDSACARRNLLADSPFMRKLNYMMSFVAPLNLIDPEDPDFVPESCRSLHDIIRFVHEKAVQTMFSIADRRGGHMRGAAKLISDIPMLFYLLDVGQGLEPAAQGAKQVVIDEIRCAPMRALWKGLDHPDIRWSEFTHFDWAEFDQIVMGGGMLSKNSRYLASYAVISEDYLNLNLRFGYHFVILDTICGDQAEKNHILFRFAGGGGTETGKALRAAFLQEVLERLGFAATKKGDLVDAEFKEAARELIEQKLDMVGRLLGATRLMDMYLKEGADVEALAGEFMNGRYHYGTVGASGSS